MKEASPDKQIDYLHSLVKVTLDEKRDALAKLAKVEVELASTQRDLFAAQKRNLKVSFISKFICRCFGHLLFQTDTFCESWRCARCLGEEQL